MSIVLEELGLPYKVHAIDFKKNEQKVRCACPSRPQGNNGFPTAGFLLSLFSSLSLFPPAGKQEKKRDGERGCLRVEEPVKRGAGRGNCSRAIPRPQKFDSLTK